MLFEKQILIKNYYDYDYDKMWVVYYKGFMTLVILDGRNRIKQEGDAISSGTHSFS
jgi:hypothetical protein